MSDEVYPVEVLSEEEAFEGENWLVLLSQAGLEDQLEWQVLNVYVLVEGVSDVGYVSLGGVHEVVVHLVDGPLAGAVPPGPLHVDDACVEEADVES